MNETPKNKPSRRFPRALLIWLIFFAVIVLAMTIVGFVTHTPTHPPYPLMVLIFGVVGASLLVGLLLFVRWLCCWRNFRRALVGVAILATLVAIFYTEEDWRGKRAWENCKRELEAKGEVLDWEKFIPPPVPDDQNFFTASTNILLRFKKAQTDAESELASKSSWLRIVYSTNSFPVFDTAKTGPLVVAEMTVGPSTGATSASDGNHSSVVKLNAADTPEQIQGLIRTTVGRGILGVAGFQFSELQLSNLAPVQIVLQSDTIPSVADLENLIPSDTVMNIGHLRVETTIDTRIFRVVLTGVRVTAAVDYLKWSDQFEPAFDEIRAALKRPYAIIPGDYSQPYLIPIANFVTTRSVAQTLAQRAQCDFLLGQPDKALRELALTHDICRILEKLPSGKPMTLVEAMINVAITGLYVSTIADGFRLHVWQEPQLAALQEQLKEIDLSPFVAKAFNEQRASACFMLANISQTELENQRLVETKRYGISVKPLLTDPEFLFITFAPRGWIYQSMVPVAEFDQKMQTAVDLTNGVLSPREMDASMRETETALDNHRLYNFFPRLFIPNVTRAWQTTAQNQTLVNEAQIACALERYHLAHGEYPEILDVLVPQFIEKLPHDIIGGQPSQGSGSASQPLHYRRTDPPSQSSGAASGKFLLYSVGWNETDDGGEPGTFSHPEQGDWVWQYPAK
ncbi:MAG: hypothetical protein ABSA45_04000 [Verrucomicrobiota bacterium]|jgi:hypothetical protein